MRRRNVAGEDEEARSLRGREILLLTLVSRLNPLAEAINILVMMSDEAAVWTCARRKRIARGERALGRERESEEGGRGKSK